jgi:hypothetical protein
MRASRRSARVESLEARRFFDASLEFVAAAQTVSNASGSVEIIFQRGDDLSGNVSVNYATSNGTALAGTDYVFKSGTVTFGPLENSKSVFVSLFDVPTAPGSQDFAVTLSSASPGAYLGTNTTHTVTLQNDRAPVALTTATFSKTTDDTGVDVVVTRGGNTDIAVSVGYETSGGTAVAGTDYTDTDGTLTFAPSETSKTVHVPLLGNAAAAANVDFGFSLLDPADGAVLLGTSAATVTITNAYSPVQFSAATYSTTTNFLNLTLTVTRTGNTSGAASVDYATSDGSAVDGEDYLGDSGTVVFAAGQTSKQINVALMGNVEAPGDLDFTVDLSSPAGSGVLGAVSSTTVTIENPYSPVRFGAAGYSVSTDDDDATIAVTRTGNTNVAATVDYETADLTALAGVDYSSASGTVSFGAGETVKFVTVPLAHNHDATDGRQFQVSFTGGTGGAVLDAPATTTVTIGNDYSPIQFAATSYDASTDDATVTLTVTRTGNVSQPATVDYATADATALAGDDYAGASGTLSFAAGEATETIVVPILGNFAADPGGVFAVALSNAAGTGAQLGADDHAVVAIDNLHSVVQLAAATYDADVRDGTVVVSVTRVGNLDLPASVDYATADGTAVAGEDYAADLGILAFGAGEATQTVTLSLLGDASSPAAATFSFTVSAPAGNASIGAVNTATITVENQDSVVQFAAGEYAVDADAGSVTLTVTRAGNTTLPATVDFATTDGTGAAGVDYTATTGTVTFLSGQTSRTVSVPVLVHASGPESVDFTVALSNAGGALIGAADATGVTVHNINSVVAFESAAATVSGDDGVATLVVRRTGNTSLEGSVSYATFSDTAVAGEDYTPTAGVLSFAAGEVSKTISVSLPGNPFAAAQRAFRVVMSDAAGSAVIGAADASVVTVTNSHSVVALASATYTAGESAGAVVFTITRVGNLGPSVSIGYVTADGTATAGADYGATGGTVTFASGQDTATVEVLVNSDLEFDPGETFVLSLTGPGGAAVVGSPASAVVTLNDTTPPPTFSGGGLVAVVKPGRLDALSLTFDQALEAAPPASAFTLYRKAGERPGVAPRLLPVVVTGATYDAATHAVTVHSLRPLKPGAFYQLAVDPAGVRNAGGKALDGAGTGEEGSPLVVTFGRGRSLKYVDSNGDTVRLSLKGPGVMELVRRPDGEGERLTLVGATALTRLVGTVRAPRTGGEGATTLGVLGGLGGATNLLAPEIEVGQIV